MRQPWDRDATSTDEHRSQRHREITDDEIELLKHKPGLIERAVFGIRSAVARKRADTGHRPVCHSGESLSGASFVGRFLVEADFSNCQLIRAEFTGSKLERACFAGADLREANLAKAVLVHADFRGANLAGANLIGADFTGADLTGADLSGSYVWGADFNDCDLLNTDLTGAYAGGAFFSHARNLTLEQFRSTIHDETGAYRLSMLPDDWSKP